MKITILGCGASSGVPVIFCECSVCLSNHEKNKRLRSSILIQKQDTNVIIDTTPDFRKQILNNPISNLNGIIYTHAHADHINGIDDVRPISNKLARAIDIYSDEKTINVLRNSFDYAFSPYLSAKDGAKYASLKENIINVNKYFMIRNLKFNCFTQKHGGITSLGILIDDKVAYSTDVSDLSDESLEIINNIDIWIIDCLSEEYSYAHANLDKILDWIKIVKPKRTILTHLSHKIDYWNLSERLDSSIELAYDNMEIIV